MIDAFYCLFLAGCYNHDQPFDLSTGCWSGCPLPVSFGLPAILLGFYPVRQRFLLSLTFSVSLSICDLAGQQHGQLIGEL
jgi:hypothetical protein